MAQQIPPVAPTAHDPSPVYSIKPVSARVKDLPASLRPREDLERRGAACLSDQQLLAILLRTGKQGLNAMDLARELLGRYQTLGRLTHADWQEIQAQRLPGLGRVKAMELNAALEIGRRISVELSRDGERPQIAEPAAVMRLMAPMAQQLSQEVFWVLALDTKNRLLGNPIEVTRGLIDASLVHPREVFRHAIRHCASAVILAHNHPSGDPTPSAEDLRVTRQLSEAGRVIDVRVLDHVIVGREADGRSGYLSMREAGMVRF